VANALRARGEEVRFVFHADTIDPLRKIAPGIPERFEEVTASRAYPTPRVATSPTPSTFSLPLRRRCARWRWTSRSSARTSCTRTASTPR
jgi:thioesterase domain-containing protein